MLILFFGRPEAAVTLGSCQGDFESFCIIPRSPIIQVHSLLLSSTFCLSQSRDLKIRCYEHLGHSRGRGNCASPSPSSIWDHIKQSGHVRTLEDFSIISNTTNLFDLLIHEIILIQRDRPNFNSQQYSISMVLF